MGLVRLAILVANHNLRPSLNHILRSPTFWLLSIAHFGSSLVRTSERIVPYYIKSTNPHVENAASLAIFHGIGTVFGLLLSPVFSNQQADPRARKYMVSRLFTLSVVACYVLAFTAILPESELRTIVQVMAVFAAAFGVAIPAYQIPSLVGTSFGSNQGLFLAYLDGVGYIGASITWKVLRPDVVGWGFAWSAVAPLVLIAGVWMVEFMEHYFCRPRRGNYETILLA